MPKCGDCLFTDGYNVVLLLAHSRTRPPCTSAHPAPPLIRNCGQLPLPLPPRSSPSLTVAAVVVATHLRRCRPKLTCQGHRSTRGVARRRTTMWITLSMVWVVTFFCFCFSVPQSTSKMWLWGLKSFLDSLPTRAEHSQSMKIWQIVRAMLVELEGDEFRILRAFSYSCYW